MMMAAIGCIDGRGVQMITQGSGVRGNEREATSKECGDTLDATRMVLDARAKTASIPDRPEGSQQTHV